MGTRANSSRTKRRPAARTYRESFVQRNRTLLFALAGVILVGGLLAIAIIETTSSDGSAASRPSTPLDASVADSLQSVPTSVFAAVGNGSAANPPTSITGTPITENGKPEVLYVGAEYCPFCAAERWPLLLALSRFGTFTNLQASHSAGDDSFPHTPTVSFYGSTYESPYLAFTPVEMYTNEREGGSYGKLQELTDEQQKIVSTYNAGGGIPYLYMGGKYEIGGANFNPSLLANLSVEQVAAKIQDTGSQQSQAIVGSANVLTAALCKLTGGQPGEVCSAPEVVKAASSLK